MVPLLGCVEQLRMHAWRYLLFFRSTPHRELLRGNPFVLRSRQCCEHSPQDAAIVAIWCSGCACLFKPSPCFVVCRWVLAEQYTLKEVSLFATRYLSVVGTWTVSVKGL